MHMRRLVCNNTDNENANTNNASDNNDNTAVLLLVV